MCIKFLCCECKEAKYDYCKGYFDGRAWCYVNAKSPCSEERNSCITCKTLCSTINRLNAMFQWEPWWATHGKGVEPENPAWELEAFKEAEAEMESTYDSEGEDSDGFTKTQRKDVRDIPEKQE
ncbi:hypothetical protein LTR99_000180 [Exophiala xenobiotica]|uniref:Uncharacterized protein n=1 Tax=Vermiconidia calcicola TaxID=1690605 RepID=A0AAV9PUR8_9PEZI|nr:hypothetical protein LTR41_007510 [Exophiala xenobiotica]KAK5530012.1 hypothetical protein LTR25_009256 [Vermiconidia calcicola]KAK5547331.1 hypothetical protein LTR23_002551 [Chaetothyriales sp. CCFEE 6169]KAK5232542.1 hypothetical protein LTR47_006430 [Exophiala xenobiotica]KAK5242268.1 hypothetical protein LTS06_011627 [Exophiala xenobiotica]